jgi:hypothetical protein
MKFFITCAVLEFFISTFYRIVQVKDSRTQIETIINVYSLLLIGAIFIHETISCLIPRVLSENFKLITHYTGKGVLFIMVSFIYFSPSLGNQQNYSAYLLFFVGLICLFADCRVTTDPEATTGAGLPVAVLVHEDKPSNNPYDIPEDF